MILAEENRPFALALFQANNRRCANLKYMGLNLKTTFNVDAERYHAMRPKYPPELVEKIIKDTGLSGNARLLEIGPGTGQATEPLAKRGYVITAIELGDELASKAREALRAFPNVKVVTGAFEDVELPKASFDLIYSATAFHWIQPEVKYTKTYQLLKPGGYLAIIHTEHVSDEAGDKFIDASRPLYVKYTSAEAPVNKIQDFRLPHLADLKPPKDIDTALFALENFSVFPLVITYTAQEYVDLLATYSPNIALPEEKRTAFFDGIKELIVAEFGGQLDKHYGMTLALLRRGQG